MRRPTNKQAFLKYLLRTRSALKTYIHPQRDSINQLKQANQLDVWPISPKITSMEEAQVDKVSIDLYQYLKRKSPTSIQKGSFVIKNTDRVQLNEFMMNSHSHSAEPQTNKYKIETRFEISGKELPLIKQERSGQKVENKRYKFFKDKSVESKKFPMFENIRLKQSLELKRNIKTEHDEPNIQGETDSTGIYFHRKPKISILINELSINKVVLNTSKKGSSWINSRKAIKEVISK